MDNISTKQQRVLFIDRDGTLIDEPKTDFDAGLKATVEWYKDNKDWWQPLFLK